MDPLLEAARELERIAQALRNHSANGSYHLVHMRDTRKNLLRFVRERIDPLAHTPDADKTY